MENIHFESKPRHVTPQIDHLGKTSPVLRVSTHMYEVSKEIDGKTFMFRVNLVLLLLHRVLWFLYIETKAQQRSLDMQR